MTHAAGAFLTAEWRYLAMLNYSVPPELLQSFVPRGTELDLWNGRAYVSVVGFYFRDTRVLGVPIPLHRTFEEVNLRFYVRRVVDGEIRRGVTFIRELVPRAAIAAVARLTYNEPYRALPMRHAMSHAAQISVDYEWKGRSGWSGVHLTTDGPASPMREGSDAEFITHHLWGYTKQRDGTTVEYEVSHPRWNVWRAGSARLSGDTEDVFPAEFASVLSREPESALLADGSPVTVYRPRRL